MVAALTLERSGDRVLEDGRAAVRVPLPDGEMLLAARDPIRPGARIAVLLHGGDGPIVEEAIWGVAPRHVGDRDAFRRRYRTHRAHAETLASSRVFAPLWRRAQRCAIPLSGWQGWTPEHGRGRWRSLDGCVFGAGLYTPATEPDGSDLRAALIVREGVPVVVPLRELSTWLTPDSPDPQHLLDSFPPFAWREIVG